jgi:hypothetical protein
LRLTALSAPGWRIVALNPPAALPVVLEKVHWWLPRGAADARRLPLRRRRRSGRALRPGIGTQSEYVGPQPVNQRSPLTRLAAHTGPASNSKAIVGAEALIDAFTALGGVPASGVRNLARPCSFAWATDARRRAGEMATTVVDWAGLPAGAVRGLDQGFGGHEWEAVELEYAWQVFVLGGAFAGTPQASAGALCVRSPGNWNPCGTGR